MTTAENAADLIDHIKKNVRVVDKWVSFGTDRYLLHVDENAELLFEERGDDTSTRLDICLRYKNERGEDVYELFTRSDSERSVFSSRVTYIPGKRYE